MSTTGGVLPGSAVTAQESPWSDNDWTTPTNISADDGNTANVTGATYDADDQTWVLKAYNFDFSMIPDGSTINGVTCIINAWYATSVVSVDLMQLLDVSRAKVGTNQCATPVALGTGTGGTVTKGSSSDLWGNVLTAAWVKDPDFGVALGFLAGPPGGGNTNNDVYVDYVTLEIDYTPPATQIEIGKSSLALSGKTLTANIQTVIAIGRSSLSLVGQPVKAAGFRPGFMDSTGGIFEDRVGGPDWDKETFPETIVIGKSSLALSPQALKVSEVITPAKSSLALSGKMVNAAEQLTLAKSSLALVGQALAVNAQTSLEIPKATLNWDGQTLGVNARENILISKSSLLLSGKSLTPNIVVTIIPATSNLLLTGQTLGVNAQEVLEISKSALLFTGKAVSISGNEIIVIGKSSFLLTGYPLKTGSRPVFKDRTGVIFEDRVGGPVWDKDYVAETIVIGKAALLLSPKALGVNAQEILTLSKASLLYTGEPLSVNAKTSLTIGRSTLTGTWNPLKASEQITIGRVPLILTGKELYAGERLTIGKSSLAFTGGDLDILTGETIQIGAGNLIWTGENLTVLETILLLHAILTFRGKGVTFGGAAESNLLYTIFRGLYGEFLENVFHRPR